MAIDGTPTIVREIKGGAPWAVTTSETDASTAVELKAKPGSGYSLYITAVVLTSDNATAHPHLQDEDNNVLFGPLNSTVEGIVVAHNFLKPIKLASNKALQLKAAAVGNVTVYIEGMTSRDMA